MTMEIRLKERLVGAMVLVLLAVIFIPMVLDGPNANRRISQSVALPDPAESDARRTVRLDLDAATTSEAAAEAAEPGAQSAEPVVVDLVEAQERTREPAPARNESPEPVAEKPAASSPAAAERASDASWTVQAGSFSSDENAETLAAKLRKLGHPAYVSRYSDDGRTHYRVRVGGFPSRDAAQRKADEIRAETGEPATPVQAP